MSNVDETGEPRQVEQDRVGRPAERAEQVRRGSGSNERPEDAESTVQHTAGNTGANSADVDDTGPSGAEPPTGDPMSQVESGQDNGLNE